MLRMGKRWNGLMCTNPMRVIVALVLLCSVGGIALAHDNWISRGKFRNAAGEWCCGEGDCFVVPGERIGMTPTGYRLYESEIVPYSEAQPSPDGTYWRCMRPDGSRRCFFAPQPLM
jgi:hypothetical protein